MDQTNTANSLYQCWDEDAVRERKDDHDSSSPLIPSSSSFTAINISKPNRLLTPQPSAPDPPKRTCQYRTRLGGTARRRRNATVAEYLGLGSLEEPAHLEKYAPLRDGPHDLPPKPARKRNKLSTDIVSDNLHLAGRERFVPIQRPVSQGRRVTKPRSKLTAKHETTPAVEASQSQSDCTLEETLSYEYEHPESSTSQGASPPITPNAAVTNSPAPNRYCSQDTIPHSSVEQYTDTHDLGDFDECGILSDSDHHRLSQLPVAELNREDEEFGNEFNDEELLELTSDMIDIGPSTINFSTSPIKVDADEKPGIDCECAGSPAIVPIIVEEEVSGTQRTSKKFVSPVTLTTRLLAATGYVNSAEGQKPIVRSPFPDAVRDRSPIIGLSSDTLLRTCFRIGEIINQAHQARKSGNQIIFELYARILDAKRNNVQQHFTLCDLFHSKPPYVKAAYDAALWRSSQLFDYDSKRLLQQGRICRCMGKMKRERNEWVMTVLNIWEATWDDIKWVEGIVRS